MKPQPDDPQERANRKIIEHLAEVYRKEGEEALKKRVAEIIKLIEEWSEKRGRSAPV